MSYLPLLLGLGSGCVVSVAAVVGTWYGGKALMSTILPVLRLSPTGKRETGSFAVGYRQNIGGWLKVSSVEEEIYVPPFSMFYPIDHPSLRSPSLKSEKNENINGNRNTTSDRHGDPSWCPFNDRRFVTAFGHYSKLPKRLFHRWIDVTMDCEEGPPLTNDARVRTTPKVVIFCHGLAGHQNCYSLLVMEMAARGYIVICPTFLDGSASFAKLRVPKKIQESKKASTSEREVSVNTGENDNRLKDISHLLLSPEVLKGSYPVADISPSKKGKLKGMSDNNTHDYFTLLYCHHDASYTDDQVRDLREQQVEVRQRTIDVFRKILGNTNGEGEAFFSEFLNTCNNFPHHSSSPHNILKDKKGKHMRDTPTYCNFLATDYESAESSDGNKEGVDMSIAESFANGVSNQGICMTGHSYGASTAVLTTLKSTFQKQEEEKDGLIYIRCAVTYDTWWLPVTRKVDQLLLLRASNDSNDICASYILPPLVIADSEQWESYSNSVSLVKKLKKLWGSSSSVWYFPKDLVSNDKFVMDWEKQGVIRGEQRTTFTGRNHNEHKKTKESVDTNRERCHYIVFEAADHVTFSDIGTLTPYLTRKRITKNQHPDEMRIGIFADLLAQIDPD